MFINPIPLFQAIFFSMTLGHLYRSIASELVMALESGLVISIKNFNDNVLICASNINDAIFRFKLDINTLLVKCYTYDCL